MKEQLEMAQLIVRYDIRTLEANIENVRMHFQALQPKLQLAKQHEISAKAILERADSLVKENEELEKVMPSLRQKKDWPQAVLVALEAQAAALKEYDEAREDYRKIQEKYDEYSKQLREFEAEHRERIQLYERLSSEQPSAAIEHSPPRSPPRL
jgi:phage FluMu gp28-like protein